EGATVGGSCQIPSQSAPSHLIRSEIWPHDGRQPQRPRRAAWPHSVGGGSALLGEHVEARMILALAWRRMAAERLVLALLVLVGFRLLLFLVAALLTLRHGVLSLGPRCEAGWIALIGAGVARRAAESTADKQRV